MAMKHIDQRLNAVLFVSVWILILAPIIVSCYIAGPAGFLPMIVLWVLAVILGTTGIFLAMEERNERWMNALLVLGLLLATPAKFISFLPVPLFGIVLYLICGGNFDLVGDPDAWGNPVKCVGGILFAIAIGAVTALLLLAPVKRVARWALRKCRGHLTWLLPFPVCLAACFALHVIVLGCLYLLRILGLYPIEPWWIFSM